MTPPPAITAGVRQVLAAQARVVAEHHRRWRRGLSTIAADGDDPAAKPGNNQAFLLTGAARQLLGVGVAAALTGSRIPRRAHQSTGEAFQDAVYTATEHLLGHARAELGPPPGHPTLCCWCLRGVHRLTGENPLPLSDEARPVTGDRPARLWHSSCLNAFRHAS